MSAAETYAVTVKGDNTAIGSIGLMIGASRNSKVLMISLEGVRTGMFSHTLLVRRVKVLRIAAVLIERELKQGGVER